MNTKTEKINKVIDRLFFIKTYGCQMNVYDSTRMHDLLENFGYHSTSDIEQASIVILNTCHIREKASEKVYSELGRIKQIKDNRIKQDHDEMIIIVAGCVGQAEGEEIFVRAPYVDIVVGPQSYYNLPVLITRIIENEKHLIELDFILEEKFDKLPQEVTIQGISTYISVQEGCDKFCTFCVVPYTRGAEFSRPIEQVYREVLQHVSKGAREITLLGQNVTAYHGLSPDNKECNLADVISYIAQISELERIRYTTSHPADMTSVLINIYASEPKLMPFLHLPIQSGSDNILKAMNRRHTRNEYLQIVQNLKIARADLVMSSDFIVGFPGETDEDFADTLDLVKQVKYGQCYSFKYSPRPGTPAATKPQIPEHIKDERLKLLQAELNAQQLLFNQSCIGRIMPVLFDRAGRSVNQVVGKTPYMQSVHIEDVKNELQGKIVNVRITKAFASSLTGELISTTPLNKAVRLSA